MALCLEKIIDCEEQHFHIAAIKSGVVDVELKPIEIHEKAEETPEEHSAPWQSVAQAAVLHKELDQLL
jgi:hypothetical protein